MSRLALRIMAVDPRIVLLAVAALTLSPLSDAAAQTPPASRAAKAVESVARDYIEGWYWGDVERMERALHGDLVKRIPVVDSLGARLHAISRARMVELTAGGGGENPDAVVQIIVDDVSDDIATARVLSPEYLDYLHLARTPEGWKIVNVLFRRRE